MDDQQHTYILLGTYNGARYLQAQIESIGAQTVDNWTLLIRDDGSSDATRKLLTSLADADPRLEVMPDEGKNLGCVRNYSHLATVAFERGARYVMFADQDDVWFPAKIEQTLECMQTAERRHRSDTPTLVHTDLEVIDQHGLQVHPSFMHFQRIRHEPRWALRTLLVQNFVTGCTAMVNRPLLAVALPVPDDALMHDWWFALCAAACGAIDFVPRGTMAYRRHGENTVTARGFWRTMNPLRTDWRQVWSVGIHDHARAVLQAETLLARLCERGSGSGSAKRLVEAYVGLHGKHQTGPSRLARALALGLRSQTLTRTAVFYLRLLRWTRLASAGAPVWRL